MPSRKRRFTIGGLRRARPKARPSFQTLCAALRMSTTTRTSARIERRRGLKMGMSGIQDRPEEENDEVEKDAVEEACGGDAQLEAVDDAAKGRDDRRR
jgi:hypothetical protein